MDLLKKDVSVIGWNSTIFWPIQENSSNEGKGNFWKTLTMPPWLYIFVHGEIKSSWTWQLQLAAAVLITTVLNVVVSCISKHCSVSSNNSSQQQDFIQKRNMSVLYILISPSEEINRRKVNLNRLIPKFVSELFDCLLYKIHSWRRIHQILAVVINIIVRPYKYCGKTCDCVTMTHQCWRTSLVKMVEQEHLGKVAKIVS